MPGYELKVRFEDQCTDVMTFKECKEAVLSSPYCLSDGKKTAECKKLGDLVRKVQGVDDDSSDDSDDDDSDAEDDSDDSSDDSSDSSDDDDDDSDSSDEEDGDSLRRRLEEAMFL